MKRFFNEFKEFINRGNVMDLAVAVIIGGAFTGIVTSLTTDIINPLITVIAGGGANSISGLVIPGTGIDFGKFISAVINFIMILMVVFGVKGEDAGSAREAVRIALHHDSIEQEDKGTKALAHTDDTAKLRTIETGK